MSSSSPVPSIFDPQALTALKGGLRKDDPKALKAAAQQFEAVFLQMMLKSMRAATPQDGPFDSEQTRFYQELLDSQLAQVMAAKGGTGLAKVIERQMSQVQPALPEDSAGFPLSPPARSLPLEPGGTGLPLPDETPRAMPLPSQGLPLPQGFPSVTPTSGATGAIDARAQAFVSTLWPAAVSASRKTGIPPQFLLAQAALETGWGRQEPRLADGRPSYNPFGIKAGVGWNGAVAEASTAEYGANGQEVRVVERFRAYNSYAEAFDDYARLISSQPRYAQVLGARDAASFARGLQSAGYATDPAYADKLMRVIGSPALTMRG
jgi:flagellar protein FlgJ